MALMDGCCLDRRPACHLGPARSIPLMARTVRGACSVWARLVAPDWSRCPAYTAGIVELCLRGGDLLVGGDTGTAHVRLTMR